MTTQPEALRLADALSAAIKQVDADDDVIHVARWFVEDADAELRRLHAQRDALLEACRAMLTFIERHAPRGLQPEPGSPVAKARAAIKAVEEEA